jgi:hypothetical protein
MYYWAPKYQLDIKFFRNRNIKTSEQIIVHQPTENIKEQLNINKSTINSIKCTKNSR